MPLEKKETNANQTKYMNSSLVHLAQLAGAVEYTDCISAMG